MGNKRNRARKNHRNANNWRNIIKMRKTKKTKFVAELDVEKGDDSGRPYDNDNLQIIEPAFEGHYEVENEMQEDRTVHSDDEMNENNCLENDHEKLHQFTEMQSKEVIPDANDFNFDEFIEVDYDGDSADDRQIEIVEIYHFELDELDTFSESEQQNSTNEMQEDRTVHSDDEMNENNCLENDHEKMDQFTENECSHEDFDSELNNYGDGGSQWFQPLHDEFDFPNDVNIQCSDNVELHRSRLGGRRIVDIDFWLEQMNVLNYHSETCEFQSRMMYEKETKRGLRSIFHFHCPSCGESQRILSSYKNDETMNVNKAATLGISSIGSGFYHLEEFCAHMDIPCMSSSTFDTQNKIIQKQWNELAKHHTAEALKEEIRMAIDRGDVDAAGNALICVICDGSWGKRSYGKGFSSLSGCAAIIGFHTKKVVYYDTKNKYCDICVKSYAKTCPPNNHVCNINYTGPSSGMETEILVEGFKYCEGLGARFHKVISDGDSSAFKEISEANIYQNPELVIEKVECINHLFKNFNKKFSTLTKDTKIDKQYRRMVGSSVGDEIGRGIRMASKHWRESDVSLLEQLENLEKDCLNAPYHCFGVHENCNDYFCKKVTTPESKATVDQLKSGGIFHEILNLCNIYFASNVVSLLQDWTTNAAEELNNVIAKYLGGKRINYSLAGSYSGRCSAAVVHYNTKVHAGSEFHKHNNIVPNNGCLKIENCRINHYAKNEAARQLKPRKKATNDKVTKDYKDGQRPDLSDRAYEAAKNIQLEKLQKNRVDRDDILKDTLGQKFNRKWLETRKKLINCAYFGRIVCARGPKSYGNILEEMLYAPMDSGKTAQACHQRIYEKEALKMFSLVHSKYELQQTGLFIDKELGYLAASPLRLYGTKSIVSVQCPVKAFKKTLDQAMSRKLLPFFKLQDGEIRLNVKSQCYANIQGQLHVSGRKFAYLVVWLGPEFTIKKIAVDHSFWNAQMKNKLEFFFDKAMIKELADPRRKRKMKIRQYDASSKTFV